MAAKFLLVAASLVLAHAGNAGNTQKEGSSLTSVMSLLTPKDGDTPAKKDRLRALAAELLDDDAKGEKLAEKVEAKADVKPHEVVSAAAPVKAAAPEPTVAKKHSLRHHRTAAAAALPLSGLSAAAGLEEVLTSLMLSKGGHGETPLSEQTDKIKALIEDEMLPKIEDAHTDDQTALDDAAAAITACATTKDASVTAADAAKTLYETKSPEHKSCRTTEGEKLTEKTECHEELANKETIKTARCDELISTATHLSNAATNTITVSRPDPDETDETYIKRVHDAFCAPSDQQEFLDAKEACDTAESEFDSWTTQCATLDSEYETKVTLCTNLQKEMDDAACDHAVQMKNACTAYEACYTEKETAYHTLKATVEENEAARHNEWKATKRMHCLVEAFSDGKIEDSEITHCKDKTHATDDIKDTGSGRIETLHITYPSDPVADACVIPDLYPSTAAYKLAEFSTLPSSAQGDDSANVCTAITTISTEPNADAYPTGCECRQVTLVGTYSAGGLVHCTGCTQVSKSTQTNSCPQGTKLFAPASRTDWDTFFASGEAVSGSPQFIIDITRPEDGCGGCKNHPMNSGQADQSSWVTSDGSAWWLRADGSEYSEPNGDYHANCYLHVSGKDSSDNMNFNDGSCSYSATDYYCQLKAVDYSANPEADNPDGCLCEKVELTGTYSPGDLVKCTGCIEVSQTTQTNSCPSGFKIFSPRSREDWTVVFASGGPLRAPNWIVDVTKPSTSSGTSYVNFQMNSDDVDVAAWVTSDGSPWWLRSETYSEPNGDYTANCYLDLWAHPEEQDNADNVVFNDGSCGYKSSSYYCQPIA